MFPFHNNTESFFKGLKQIPESPPDSCFKEMTGKNMILFKYIVLISQRFFLKKKVHLVTIIQHRLFNKIPSRHIGIAISKFQGVAVLMHLYNAAIIIYLHNIIGCFEFNWILFSESLFF